VDACIPSLKYLPDGKGQLKQIITNTRTKGRDEKNLPSFMITTPLCFNPSGARRGGPLGGSGGGPGGPEALSLGRVIEEHTLRAGWRVFLTNRVVGAPA
jgi:hypothetical protein